MTSRTKHIATVFNPVRNMTGFGYAHMYEIIQGICRYADECDDWAFAVWGESMEMSAEDLIDWDGDGAIVAISTPEQADIVRGLSIPAVNFFCSMEHPGVPNVRYNFEEQGRMAADHLAERGFQRLAYYGTDYQWFSQLRQAGFEARAAELGIPCQRCLVSKQEVALRDGSVSNRLEPWLKGLRTPIGIMAASDLRAKDIYNSCRRLGIDLSEQIGLIGVDNDPLIGHYESPSLTSIAQDGVEMGYEVARLLDDLIEGRSREESVVVSAGKIVSRQSTDCFGVDDERLRNVLKYIDQNLGRPFYVATLQEKFGMSRRWLEQAFQKAFRCTPHTYITRRRVHRACERIARPDRPKIGDVAVECGFTSHQHMNAVFKRVLGKAPQAFRKRS